MHTVILGNAYLSQFFTTSSEPKLLKQSMSAYHQAERDSGVANNPDLHFNMATLCLYEENYDDSLTGFRRASALDPGWDAPKLKITETTAFLQAMTHSLSAKGKMKSKKAGASLSAALSTPDKFAGPLSQSKTLVSVSDLRPGGNLGAVFVGGVSAIVPTANRVPYACALVDSSGSHVGLTVYNLADSAHFNIGDIITIPDPHFKKVQLDADKVDFCSIRCTEPHRLLVNGEKLSTDKLALSVLAVKTFN
jgi:hypothetical protein